MYLYVFGMRWFSCLSCNWSCRSKLSLGAEWTGTIRAKGCRGNTWTRNSLTVWEPKVGRDEIGVAGVHQQGNRLCEAVLNPLHNPSSSSVLIYFDLWVINKKGCCVFRKPFPLWEGCQIECVDRQFWKMWYRFSACFLTFATGFCV